MTFITGYGNIEGVIQIAPSLLSCDFAHLAEQIRVVEAGGCDVLHLDVMDGHFVPNITFGPVVIKAIHKSTSLPLDAHLMIENPEKWIENFAAVGVDWISFHAEAAQEPAHVIKLIKEKDVKAGIAINPDTPVETVFPWLEDVDFVLIMTVHPGFGGQKFISEPLEKIKILSQKGIAVEVDGGINESNIDQVVKAGATIVVSGSGIFKTEDPAATVKKLKTIASGCL